MIKYGRRGSNLAVCFLRQGISSNEHERSGNKAYSGAELGLVKSRVVWTMKKDVSGSDKVPFLVQDHFNGRNEVLKKC